MGAPSAASDLGPVVILGVAGDERVAGFDAALARASHAPAHGLDYADFVAEPRRLTRLFPHGRGVLRLESPGAGARIRDAVMGRPGLDDESRMMPLRGLHDAFVRLVRQATALAPRGVVAMSDPAAIALAYDKVRCHAAMQAHGLPVPAALPGVASAQDLLAAMRGNHMDRVFVKPRFGSGAVGVAAVAALRDDVVVTSSARLDDGVLRHGRRLRRVTGREALALLDAIIALEVHVERWAPKAAVEGRPADLRVLVIAGEIAHIVVRLGNGPITNLDLGARRAEPAMLRDRVAPAAWDAMLADCRRFAALFPRQMHLAFDVAMLPGGRRHVFFEANAFGDLLRRVRHEDRDPYDAQVALLPGWVAARSALVA